MIIGYLLPTENSEEPFNTGTVRVQGKQVSLVTEFEKLKQEILKNPQTLSSQIKELQACTQTYDIMLDATRDAIKESIKDIGMNCSSVDKPKSNVEYKAKIERNESAVNLTQYNTGKLVLQGKRDALFEDCCDRIEKIATPTGKEVITRFISNDEKSLEYFTAKYTPELLEVTEKNVREKLGQAYDYLETYDQSWFMASEAMCLIEMPFREFSPIVMPASKAFEGFAKKLLISIGLFDASYFKGKSNNFSRLSDPTNPKRQAICAKHRYAESFLKKMSLCLEFNRNFMLHSDDSEVTKINSRDAAEQKLNDIYKDTKEIFDFFNNKIFSLV